MFLRDLLMTSAVFGFFAAAWFGWAQQRPPMTWRTPLAVGSVTGMLVAIAAGIFAWMNWHGGSALRAHAAFTQYLIIVGIEFGAAGLGALLLFARHRADYMPVWICLVVGVHLLPMAEVLGDPGLYVLGSALTLVALASPRVSRRLGAAISAVTGAGSGTLLIAYSLGSAVRIVI